jgi:FkbM family methyltransferase
MMIHLISQLSKRLLEGIKNPEFMYFHLRNWVKLLKNGRWGPLYGAISKSTTGSNRYVARLEESAENGLVLEDLLGFKMLLDTNDPGLSSTLLKFGVREEVSTEIFARELRRLAGEVDGDVTVLDVGANIGYFVLVAVKALGSRGNVFAIEPINENIELLEKNVELNDARNTVSVHQVAIGDQNEQIDFHLAERSNHHSPHQTDEHEGALSIGAVTVERFLREQGISPDSVHAVRMDLEGYEVEVFERMDGLLASEPPLLLFIELHPGLRSPEDLNRILDRLDRNGFEIVSTTVDVWGDLFDQGWREDPVQFDDFSELKRYIAAGGDTVLLIAKKSEADSG